MFLKRTETRSRYFLHLAALSIVVALFAGLAKRTAFSDVLLPKEINARTVIEQLSDALAEGRRESGKHLSRLGFATEVEEIQRLDNTQLFAFSSDTMIETLYRRAEAQSEGEGDRFLAVLYNDAKKTSAALAIDPDFAMLQKFSADDLDVKKRPFKFAALEAVSNVDTRPPLSPIAEKAINKLAEVYSARGLAQARVVVLRNFRKEGFDGREFERALAESRTTKEAWQRLVRDGTPPPPLERALRDVLRDAMAGSAALSVDRSALEIMEELSRELPPELERYIEVENQLESRKLQMAEADEVKRPGKIFPSKAEYVLAMIAAIPETAPSTQRATNGRETQSASQTNNNDEKGRPDEFTGLSGSSNKDPGGGGGGGSPRSRSPSGTGNAEYTRFAKDYSNYTSQTFEPRGGSQKFSPGSTLTPRSYRVAIRSARAARGIAIGGAVSSQIEDSPIRAVWLPNRKDDRFGRLFVEFSATQGKSALIGASRVLFADSFYAATSVLWGKHDTEATFRDGEILVLISMDPNGSVMHEIWKPSNNPWVRAKLQKLDVEARKKATKKLEELDKLAEQKDSSGTQELSHRQRALAVEVDNLLEPGFDKLDLDAMFRIWEEAERLKDTRGIVTHPAIVGRELSWSAARVDFWFNQMDRLSAEAAIMNSSHPIPENLMELPIHEVRTWQFFERDCVIQSGQSDGRARRFVVSSKSTGKAKANPRSHFGISMFGKKALSGSESAEDGFYRLKRLEGQIQPLLDWLAVNHHDFMRLNDFSEALSLLRWLASKQTELTVIDMDGQGEAIVTPDRVERGMGPHIGSQSDISAITDRGRKGD